MPQRINDYKPVLSLLSTARLASVPAIFNVHTDLEKYGFSLWIQNAAASLYPLVQQLELVLRNSVDKTARTRFGERWWDAISYDTTKDNHDKFINCIREAERSLLKKWKAKEVARLGLRHPSEVTTTPPVFSHDDIIAATTFSTWENVFLEALHTEDNSKKTNYLWPNSLPKVLRRLSEIDNKPVEARRKLLNLLKEIRDYRNRLFHHDCIWIKIKTVDRQTAIESIREKINLIEKIIIAISPVTNRALNAWGMYANARRICSTAELSIYTNLNYQVPDIATSGLLGQFMLQTNGGKETVTMMLQNEACVFYKLR